MSQEKTQAELLKEELFATSSHAAYTCPDEEIAQADAFCEGYKDFLDAAKTEREAVKVTIELAKANGFKEFKADRKYEAGEKVEIVVEVIDEKGEYVEKTYEITLSKRSILD